MEIWKQRLLDAGHCVTCCKKRPNNDAGSKLYCAQCLKRKNESDKQRKLCRIQKGLCGQCGLKRESIEKRKCDACILKQKQIRKTKILNGICSNCMIRTIDKNGTNTYCSFCMKLRNNTLRRLKEKRLLNRTCLQCNKKMITNLKYCSECLKKFNKKLRKIIKNKQLLGQCTNCQNKTWYQSAFCEYHFVRSRWFKYKLSEDSILKLLQKLKDSNFKCFYTGKELIPGRDCVIDHLKPRARFPELTNDPNNIVWCSTSVNAYKKKLTDDEFIEYCKTNYNKSKIAKAVIDYQNQKDK